MTNFEKYKDEIYEIYNNLVGGDNTQKFYSACEKVFKKYKVGFLTYADRVYRWLGEEYVEHNKLTVLERDLLEEYIMIHSTYGAKLDSIYFFQGLIRKGYFKNVNQHLRPVEILEKCEVIVDEQ